MTLMANKKANIRPMNLQIQPVYFITASKSKRLNIIKKPRSVWINSRSRNNL